MAAGKLMEIVPTRPITYRNQNFVNLSLLRAGRRGRRLSRVLQPSVLAGLCRDRRAVA